MKKTEKLIWRVFLWLSLAFCTLMFAASCAGDYPQSRLIFFMLCMTLLAAI